MYFLGCSKVNRQGLCCPSHCWNKSLWDNQFILNLIFPLLPGQEELFNHRVLQEPGGLSRILQEWAHRAGYPSPKLLFWNARALGEPETCTTGAGWARAKPSAFHPYSTSSFFPNLSACPEPGGEAALKPDQAQPLGRVLRWEQEREQSSQEKVTAIPRTLRWHSTSLVLGSRAAWHLKGIFCSVFPFICQIKPKSFSTFNHSILREFPSEYTQPLIGSVSSSAGVNSENNGGTLSIN